MKEVLREVLAIRNGNDQPLPLLQNDATLIGFKGLRVVCFKLLDVLEVSLSQDLDDRSDEYYMPFVLNTSYRWCGDLLTLVNNNSRLQELFKVDGNSLNFNDNISSHDHEEIRKILVGELDAKVTWSQSRQ